MTKQGRMTQKVLLYGATGGIGSALARTLRAKGCRLHLVGRDEEKLSAMATELDADFTAGDVLENDVHKRVAQAAGEQIQGFVYAVGTLNLKGFTRLDPEAILNDFKINALGAALALQAVLPALKRSDPGAAVVLFSSIAAQQGFTAHASMSMAKGAVSGLTLALAAELAPQIRVNAIAPSLTRTPLSAGLLSNEKMATALAQLHPLPRLGRPTDMAQLASFLLSPEADWITGQVIAVDGGRTTLQVKR
jgi:NAD(P)-dependent dehydrogenase (short-subunit alcohol dehydrogenase family)